MENLIADAAEHGEKEDERRKQKMEELGEASDPRIVIVGVGGGGNNTVTRLHNLGVEGAETIAVNTDKQDLQMAEADQTVLIGKDLTNGRGAGGDPSMGERAAEAGREGLTNILEDADLVFVAAGMGGGTGTGASPVIAEIAKDHGAIVVGMVTLPFDVEKGRQEKAKNGLDKLRKSADSVIALDNQRLLEYVPQLTIKKSFSVLDQLIAQTVKGISETITQPSLINLDYADVRKIMSKGGVAVMLVGETSANNPTEEVVSDALNHPLLDVDYRGAEGALIHITGGPQLTLGDAEGIAQGITQRLNDESEVMWGARVSEENSDTVQVLAVMTGVRGKEIYGNTSSAEDVQDEVEHVAQNRPDVSDQIDTL